MDFVFPKLERLTKKLFFEEKKKVLQGAKTDVFQAACDFEENIPDGLSLNRLKLYLYPRAEVFCRRQRT